MVSIRARAHECFRLPQLLDCSKRLVVHHAFQIVLKTTEEARGGTRDESFMRLAQTLSVTYRGGPRTLKQAKYASEGLEALLPNLRIS